MMVSAMFPRNCSGSCSWIALTVAGFLLLRTAPCWGDEEGLLSATPASRRGPPGPAPAESLTVAAQQKVRDAFAADIRAAQDSAGLGKLVSQLVDVADSQDLDSVSRHAALEVALMEASFGDEPRLVTEVLRARAEWFTDQDVLGPMVSYLTAVSEKNRGDPAIIVKAALELNQDAMDAGRPAVAEAAIVVAKAQLARAPAYVADHLRPSVQTQEAATVEILKVFHDADAAMQVLAELREDPVAHVRAGFRAAWVGRWDKAIEHFAIGRNEALQAAAKAELACPANPKAEELCAVAEKWWAAAADPRETSNLLVAEPPVLPSKTVKVAIRRHAVGLYQRALESNQGIKNPIDRKLAESRVAEVITRQQRSNYLAAESQTGSGLPPVALASTKAQAFDEPAFVRAKAEMSRLFTELGGSVADRDTRAVKRLHQELTVVRQKLCESLHLYNRDEALLRRQQLVAGMLDRQPDFGDGWLCDCYLKILDGKAAQARESLNKAVELMNKNPVRQVYCGQQLLDAGNAALLLGDRELGDKLKNFLKARVPNHPGVKLYQAMIYVDKSMFSEAVNLLDEVMKDTTGLDRAVIAADYAWLRSAVPIDRLRDPLKAKAAVSETLSANSGPHWKALRAEAALLAAEARWDEAIATLDKATLQAPLLFASELDQQRKCYLDRKGYWIERRR